MVLCERQLLERVTNVRPRMRESLEAFEHAAQQRVSRSVDEMANAVVRTEEAAMERLDSMRPRAAEMVLQLEKDVKEQLKRLEDDAVAGVHWLEHRLERRVMDLTQRMAKTLSDQANDVETQQEPTRNPPRAASPVEVQIMVESNRSPRNANAA